MLLLGRHGLLDADHALAMAEAARFRNVQVRGYAQIDDQRVVGYLQRLDAIDQFVDRLSSLL